MAIEPPAAYPDEFLHELRDALAHLHDLPYRRRHPLGGWLIQRETAQQGEQLHDLLVNGIALLRPSDRLPRATPAWRRYRSLQLRYLDHERAPAAADMLAMSERQARREHHEALEALAVLLWQRRSELSTTSELPKAPIDGASLPAPTTDVVATITSMRETLRPLLQERAGEITISFPVHLPEVVVDRVFLRQALLAVILAGFERGYRHFRLTAFEEMRAVLLQLAAEEGADLSSLGALALATPLLVDHAGEARIQINDRAGAVVFSLPKRPSLILLVDDDPDFARLFERCLAASPYTLVTLRAGEDVVARTRALRPDYVVLDVFLPSQDGWEVLQQLKGDAETSSVPVLICSVLANQQLARTLGAAGCLPKPVTPRSLLAALERCRAPLAANL